MSSKTQTHAERDFSDKRYNKKHQALFPTEIKGRDSEFINYNRSQ